MSWELQVRRREGPTVIPLGLVEWMLWGRSPFWRREGVRWPRQSLAVGAAQSRTLVAGAVDLVQGAPEAEGQGVVGGGRAGRWLVTWRPAPPWVRRRCLGEAA